MKKLVALLLTFLLVLVGCESIEVTKVEDDIETDAIRFSKEYSLDNVNNVYKYTAYDNVVDTIESGCGIIYLGFAACDLCKEVIPVLNDVAKDKGVKEILYYNFKDIRENNTEEYLKLVELLSSYLNETEEGVKKITAPTIIFVNKGNVVGVYIGKLNPDSEEIMTKEEKERLKNNFSSLIDKMLIEETTSSQEEQKDL